MFRRPLAVTLALVSTSLMFSAVACDNGTKGEEVFTEQDCLATCENILPLYAGTPGCIASCGVDEADAYGAAVGIVTPIFGVAADGQAAVGAECQLVLAGECNATCESAMTFCLSDASYSETAIAACLEAFDACTEAEQAETCGDALDQCDDSPDECQCIYEACLSGESGLDCRVCSDAYNACEEAANATYTRCLADGGDPDECQDAHVEDIAECVCIFQHCEDETDPQECLLEDGQAAFAPVVTGPGQFRVPVEMIDLYLENLEVLDHMTGLLTTTNGPPKLAHLVDNHPLRTLGLRSGDALIEANGISLKAAQQQPAMLLPLFADDVPQVKLKIRRNGVVKTFTYKIDR